MGKKNKTMGWQQIVARFAQMASVKEANASCSLWMYQRKQTDAIRKLRRF